MYKKLKSITMERIKLRYSARKLILICFHN